MSPKANYSYESNTTVAAPAAAAAPQPAWPAARRAGPGCSGFQPTAAAGPRAGPHSGSRAHQGLHGRTAAARPDSGC